MLEIHSKENFALTKLYKVEEFDDQNARDLLPSKENFAVVVWNPISTACSIFWANFEDADSKTWQIILIYIRLNIWTETDLLLKYANMIRNIRIIDKSTVALQNLENHKITKPFFVRGIL